MIYLLKGFSLLTHKGLKRFVFIPLCINVILFCFLFALAHHYFSELLQGLNHITPHWLHWLNWLLWPIFFITFSIISLYSFTLIANIISAPFNSFLAEKVELITSGQKTNTTESIWSDIKDIPRSLSREFLKIRYFLPRLALLLILFIVPGANIIAPAAWFIFGCWMMAMQYIDYPMDNHHIPLKEVYDRMRRRPFDYLLFGASVTIALMIPIVNLFVMPAAVIGATLMWQDQQPKNITL